jgi:hypothetical protein
MGMHHGFVASPVRWSKFEPHLPAFAGSYVHQGVLTEVSDDTFSINEGDVLIAGAHNDASYILDKMMLLSCGDFDHLARLSGLLDNVVVAIAGETVSGTYSLCVADRGAVRRVYYNCISAITAPFVCGEPLPSESDLEDIDGNGLLGVAAAFGLTPYEWLAQGEKNLLFMTGDEACAPAEGVVSAAFRDHWTAYERPKTGNGMWKTKVVSRRLPDGGMGFDIVPDMGETFVSRVKRWLHF